MTKQTAPASITTADLSEELLDVLNGMNAVITVLAEKAGLAQHQIKMIHMEASQRHQRAKAEAAKQRAAREAFEEDTEAMAAWVRATRFDFDNAEDWKAAAAIEWETICERNGSEHGKAHTFSYKEPTQEELLDALNELSTWERSTEDHNAAFREHAKATLPKVKQKLAKMLAA